MDDEVRQAIANIQLVLAKKRHRLWPEDERVLKAALYVLEGLNR